MSQPVAAGRAPRKSSFVGTWELCLAVGLTAAWIVLHIRFFLHAGALWRDEVNSVNLCNSPTIGGILENLQYDSFPLLWHALLRFWIRSGIGSTDRGIRVLGLLAGLGILATIWDNSRRFRTRPPIAALTLLGISTAVICYGDSIRGYGLGMLLELLTLGLIWDVATRPTAMRVGLALLIALAAVHMLFYNSVILAAICAGAVVVTIRHRHWKRAGMILGIGMVCAGSMVIYLPSIHRSDSFRMMLYHDPSLFWLLYKFQEAVGYDITNPVHYTYNDLMWGIAVVTALVIAPIALIGDERLTADSFRKDVTIYHLTVVCVGVLGYWAFLHHLSYLMQPWYYLALLALLAGSLDALFSSYPSPWVRQFVCLGAAWYCFVAADPVWQDAGLRKTAVDLDCAIITPLQHPGDLVVIAPWYYGVTYSRYYHGPADTVTVPPVGFLAYHKYDLLIKPMQDVNAMDPVLAKIETTLRSGHVVYLFGNFPYPDLSRVPMNLGPAPNRYSGWNDGVYYQVWANQITLFLLEHGTQSHVIAVPEDGFSYYEVPQVTALKGWTDARSLSPAGMNR